jgi:hypothetical protein
MGGGIAAGLDMQLDFCILHARFGSVAGRKTQSILENYHDTDVGFG